MKAQSSFSQRGIGVIEVMVAAVIFALGIVALIQLQGVFFKSSSSAQARTVAATLAEEKLEDLRSFDDGTTFSYLDIVDNGGGAVASGTRTIGNTDYTLTWDVTGFYYNSGVLTSIDPSDSNVEHKAIQISVSWLDTDGSQQMYTVDALINSNAGTSGGLLANNTGGSGEKPEVPHVELAAPDVLRVKVKDPPPESFGGTDAEWNALTESEKAEEYAQLGWCNVETYGATESPDPDIDTNNTLDNVIVRFASTKYRKYNPCTFAEFTNNTVNTGVTELVKIKEEEFLTLNCECTLSGSGPGFDQTGASVTKARTGVPTGNNQSDFCTLCCRDHHENITGDYQCNSGANPEYCIDPYRAAGDFNNSDHNHYLSSDLTTPAVIGGDYTEVCRIKRIDGFYRVIPDWMMVAHNIMVQDDFNNSAAQTDYESYLGTQINSYLQGNAVVPWSYASAAIPLDAEQMMSRSIYVDYLTASEIAAASPATNGDEVDINVDFYEYKTTLLSDWTTRNATSVDTQSTTPCNPNNSTVNACTDSPNIAAVANDPTDEKGVFRYNNSVSGDIEIVSTIAVSNSGVVSEPGIDPGDDSTASLVATYDRSFGAGPPPNVRSVQMASISDFTCAPGWTVGSGKNAVTYNLVSENITNWPAITLSCSPSSGNTNTCENYPSDQTNVTVRAALNAAALSCSYTNSMTYSCGSLTGLSGGNRLNVNGTYSCSVSGTQTNSGLSCQLVCN
jgi:hypothetical protein